MGAFQLLHNPTLKGYITVASHEIMSVACNSDDKGNKYLSAVCV